MNTALWIAQGLMATLFLFSGIRKIFESRVSLRPKLGDWVDDIPSNGLKFIGTIEVLSAIGLIVPMAFGIIPLVTPFAAIGLCITMIGAITLHLNRKEFKAVGLTSTLLLINMFIAVGRAATVMLT